MTISLLCPLLAPFLIVFKEDKRMKQTYVIFWFKLNCVLFFKLFIYFFKNNTQSKLPKAESAVETNRKKYATAFL